jgi:hypothetical protein
MQIQIQEKNLSLFETHSFILKIGIEEKRKKGMMIKYKLIVFVESNKNHIY